MIREIPRTIDGKVFIKRYSTEKVYIIDEVSGKKKFVALDPKDANVKYVETTEKVDF